MKWAVEKVGWCLQSGSQMLLVIDSFEICLVIFAVGDAVLYANFEGLNADCKVWGVASRVLYGSDVTEGTYAWLAG